MEENRIVTDPNIFSISSHKQLWEHMNTIAKTLIDSRAFPPYIQNSHQAMIVFETGHEMGLKFMESIKYLYIISGQVTLTGQGAARKLADAGYRVKYEEEKDKCTAIVYKLDPEKEIARDTVTFQEAEESGYTYFNPKNDKGDYILDKDGEKKRETKVGWREGMNRKLKLRYLALSSIIKTSLPDVLGAAIDIKEVAEDYPVEEKKKEELIPSGVKADLKNFIDKSKAKKEEVKPEIQEAEIIERAENGELFPDGRSIPKSKYPELAKTIDEVVQEKAQESTQKTLGEAMQEEAAEEPVDVDPRLVSKRKEFFATAGELGIPAETAKEEAKKHFGKQHLSEISLMDLTAYVRAMKLRLKQKQQGVNILDPK